MASEIKTVGSVGAHGLRPVGKHDDPRRALGARGEELAASFFSRQGFEIVVRNWRCKGGEIDLLIRKGDDVRVVEVKTRMSLGAGYPEEAVTEEKLERMAEAYGMLAEERPELPSDVSFDVLSIVIGANDVPVYTYLPDVE
jgi:putative endonuclease